MKLTSQGVRDLDFGWKKKPAPPVDAAAVSPAGTDGAIAPAAADDTDTVASGQVADGTAPESGS